MRNTVRVRFAPSPTGVLHVGSARTALFNWFWAQHTQGAFVLRIEDTDQQRSKAEYLDQIQASLRWLGITPDEGPVFQHERLAIYQAHAERLLAAGLARRDEGAIIFTVPAKQIQFTDSIHGTITFDSSSLKDIVLMKSDGWPAYNFACVVDDATMGMTHVIRGDDHIANTPKQLLLFDALGFEAPQYTHIPLIVDAARARLSKRTGASDILAFEREGYLSDGVVNYLALLGWSPGGDREFVRPDDITPLFDIARIKKTAAQFDAGKMAWVNAQHIKQLAPEALVDLLRPRLESAGLIGSSTDTAWLTRVVTLMQDRIKTLGEFVELADFFFTDEISYQDDAVEAVLRHEGVAEDLQLLRDRLASVDPFEPETLDQHTRQFVKDRGKTAKAVFHPVRVAITGRSVSPRLFDTMALIGKSRTLTRLTYAATQLVKA